jgi:hypothetical protein
MKKATYKKLKRDSKIPKGNQIPKELREKGKSRFLGYRKDLQGKLDIEISPEFVKREKETIAQNRARRAALKINLNPHPDSYYADCYVNSEEYKNKHKK